MRRNKSRPKIQGDPKIKRIGKTRMHSLPYLAVAPHAGVDLGLRDMLLGVGQGGPIDCQHAVSKTTRGKEGATLSRNSTFFEEKTRIKFLQSIV